MKKIILFFLLCTPFIGSTQSLEHKIPSTAEAVVAINGDRMLELFSIEEFNNLSFSKEIIREIGRNDTSITSIEDFGFNLNSKAYAFFAKTDSINYFNVFAKLSNKNAFEKLIPEYDRDKIVRTNGLNILTEYSSVTIWNDHMLLTSHGEDVSNYFDAHKERFLLQADSADQDIYDIKERLSKTWVGNYAYALFNSNPTKSIVQNKSYLAGKGKSAAYYFWIKNYGALMGQYMREFSSIFYQHSLGIEPTKNMYGIDAVWGNLYFDNAAIRVTTNMEVNKGWLKAYKKMYKSKIGSEFLNHFDQNNALAYMSISTSTQGMLEEYPSIISKVYGGMLPKYQEETSLASDLFAILLDEEAIGNVLTGNMLFILNGVSDKTVEYTTYEYDDDYNRTEVTKTKTEPMPDFTIMIGSENKALLNKFVRLAAKYELVNHKVNYYKIKEHNDIPFGLFFVIKNGVVFLTNSEKQISDIANNKTVANAGKHKSLIRKNISVLYVNGKSIMNNIPESLLGYGTEKEMFDYAKDNLSEISLTTSRLKRSKMQVELKMDTPSGKGNSLKFLMHFIEDLIDIEKDRNQSYVAPVEELKDDSKSEEINEAAKVAAAVGEAKNAASEAVEEDEFEEVEEVKDSAKFEVIKAAAAAAAAVGEAKNAANDAAGAVKEAPATIQETEIMEVVEEEEDVNKDIPFSIIEVAPVYPGCKGSNAELKKCLQKAIQKHVAVNFNTGLADELGLAAGKKRVYVVFKIDREGNIVDVRARGPHKRLEVEGIRVVKLLPQMKPGKQRGRPVGVNYTLPISLVVEGLEEVVEEENDDN